MKACPSERGLIAFFFSLALLAVSAPAPAVAATGPLPAFIENRGQIDASVRYYAEARGARIFCTDEALVIDLTSSAHVIRACFDGSRPDPVIEAKSPGEGRLNFFTGAPSQWRTGVVTYQEVVYHGLWPGIDLVLQLAQNEVVYRFAGVTGVDLVRARLRFEGADRITTGDDGSTYIVLPSGGLVDRPVSVDGSARVLRWGDGLPEPAGRAAADPGDDSGGGSTADTRDNPATLTWSTLIGGSDNEYSHGLAIDAQGCPIVTGYTRSGDFPTTPGAYDRTQGGSYDVFVARFNQTGSVLLWATFVGGTAEDRPFGLALGPDGQPVVVGHTFSVDFPTTTGAYDRTMAGPRDAFALKLSAAGDALLWSTFLGGAAYERAWGVALDSAGRPVVTGETGSSDFPTTAGAFQTTAGGVVDAFVTKLAADGRSLVWSTYLGGTGGEWTEGIVLDSQECPVVTGVTGSANYPVTPTAWDTSYAGGADCFVTRLGADGASLLGSTYLGGTGEEYGYGVAVDANGRIVVAGSTASADFPVTPGCFDPSFNGIQDVFVTSLDASCSEPGYSTFVGGSDADVAFAMILDHDGGAIFSGETSSTDYPTTADGFDRTYAGNQDAFVTRLNPNGTAMRWSSYFGGTEFDSGWDFALDDSGNPLLTGPTRSVGFPTTAGAYDRTYNGGAEDVFLLRLGITDPAGVDTATAAGPTLRAEPNPFAESTVLRFELVRPADVRLGVYNSIGRRVATLSSGSLPAGRHDLRWKGDDSRGRPVPAGVYWLRLQAGNRTQEIKLVRIH